MITAVRQAIFPSLRVLACVLLSAGMLACASTGPAPDNGEQAEPRRAQIDLSGLHPMARVVAQAGAPQCAMKVHEAAIYLIIDTESGAIFHGGSDDLYSFSLEVIDPEGMTSYVSLNVAPGVDANCAIGYEVVTPIGEACSSLAERFWPEAVHGSPLRKRTIPLGLPDGQTILLHPVGDSCLVVRKEIIP